MRRFRTVGSLLVVALVALAACSSGGGVKAPKPDAAAASDLSNLSSLFNSVSSDASDFGGGASSKLPQGDPIGKIRIVNGLTTGGQPGPAIDVYDTDKFHVDPSYQPLIKDLKYGQVSDYVSPKAWGKGDTTSNLYVFPAGTQTPTALLTGANIDNSGFEKDDQITMALFSTNNDATFGSVDVNEAGSRAQAESENSSQSSPDPSKATLLPVTAMENSNDVGQYLSLDGTCPTQTSLGTGTGTIPLLIGSPDITSFGVAVGSHTLGAITSPPGQGLIDCAGQTPASTITANLQAGKRTEVFVFGDPTKPQLVTADVAS